MVTEQQIKKYSLAEICQLINIIGNSLDVSTCVPLYKFNDKGFYVTKNGNRLIIQCSDGRELTIGIEKALQYDRDLYDNYWDEELNVAEIFYTLPNAEILRIISAKHRPENFQHLSLNLFINNLRTKYSSYIDDKRISVKGDLDFDMFKMEDCGSFYFVPKGIVHGDYLISSDGKTVLMDEDKSVLPLERLKEYDADKEIKKLQTIMDQNQEIHPIVKSILQAAEKDIKKAKEYVDSIIKFYEEKIPYCEKIVEARKQIIENVEKALFAEEELKTIIRALEKSIQEEREIQKNSKTLAEDKAKQIVKSLNSEERKAVLQQLQPQIK